MLAVHSTTGGSKFLCSFLTYVKYNSYIIAEYVVEVTWLSL